jgi:ERF superfamily protein
VSLLDPIRLAEVIADLQKKLGATVYPEDAFNPESDEVEESMHHPAEVPDGPRIPSPLTWQQSVDNRPRVHTLFLEVMRQVDKITKDDRNVQQGYSFRGVDATVNVVGPALREMGVVCIPVDMEILADREVATQRGGTMRNVTIRVHWQIVGPLGDTLLAVTLGEANDTQDKAVPKAVSVAFRELWLKGLCVPSGDPDVDSEPSPERGAPSRDKVSLHPEPGGLKAQELTEAIKRARAESGLRKQYTAAQDALQANEIAPADFDNLHSLVARRVADLREGEKVEGKAFGTEEGDMG